jgi:hypothetical protein
MADPSQSSAEEIKALLTADEGTAASMDFSEPEPQESSATYLAQAVEHLTHAVGDEQAVRSNLTSEIAASDLYGAMEEGVDPTQALAAGFTSGALSEADANALAFEVARNGQGLYSDEDFFEMPDEEFLATLDDIQESQAQLLSDAHDLAQFEHEYAQQEQAASAAFAQQVENHAQSVEAMQAFKDELRMSAPEFEQHLAEVDAQLEAGILGQPLDLDAMAKADPEFFAKAVRAVSATVRQSADEAEGMALKARVFGKPDFGAGLTVDGHPTRAGWYTPQLDEERFIEAVERRALSQPVTGSIDDFPRLLDLDRDNRHAYTLGGKPVEIDDIPSAEDGRTARSRAREEQRRGGRAS